MQAKLSKCVYRLGLCPWSPECVLGMHRACLWCLPRITRVRYWGLPDIMGLRRGCSGKSPGKVLLGFARCHGDATRLPAGRGSKEEVSHLLLSSCVIRIAHRARHPHFPQHSTAALRVIVLGSRKAWGMHSCMHRFCLGGTCTSRRVQLRRRSALRPVAHRSRELDSNQGRTEPAAAIRLPFRFKSSEQPWPAKSEASVVRRSREFISCLVL